MRHAVAGLLTLALALTAANMGSAQQRRDDGSSPAVKGSTVSLQVANTQRFVVPYYRSTTTPGFRAATVITVVNNAANACEVRVDFFVNVAGGGASPICSITATVDGGHSREFCSRSVSVGVTVCSFRCSPELGSNVTIRQGKVIVFTADTNACRRVMIDPRVYHLSGTDSDTGVVAVSNTQF